MNDGPTFKPGDRFQYNGGRFYEGAGTYAVKQINHKKIKPPKRTNWVFLARCEQTGLISAFYGYHGITPLVDPNDIMKKILYV